MKKKKGIIVIILFIHFKIYYTSQPILNCLFEEEQVSSLASAEFPNIGQGDSVNDTYNLISIDLNNMPSDLFSYDTSLMIGERIWLCRLTSEAGRILQIGNK